MARYGLVFAGILLFISGIATYSVTLSFTLAGEKMRATIPQMVAFCESGLGQFAQLSPEMVRVCSEYNTFMLGIYGSGLLGIILIIVGAVARGGPRLTEEGLPIETEKEDTSIDILKVRYAKGEITKEEFDKMKDDLENS